LVSKVRIGGDAVNLDAQLLELLVLVREILELRGTHEGEVGGVEDHDRPLALEGLIGNVHELAVVESRRLEGFDGSVDQTQLHSPLGAWLNSGGTKRGVRLLGVIS